MRTIRIAVLDSGWDTSIKDSRVCPGKAFIPQQLDHETLPYTTSDRIGHGTACSDVILQVYPVSSIMPVKIFDRSLETSPQVVLRALSWLETQDVKLINMSFVMFNDHDLLHLYAACERLRRRGRILVASSPNSGELNGAPASFEPVIGVAGSGVIYPPGFVYDEDRGIECTAPARHFARSLGGEVRSHFGSSYATAYATGVIARLLGTNGDMNIDQVRAELRRRFRRSADRVWN